MDFELTAEQKALQDMAYKFAKNEFGLIGRERRGGDFISSCTSST